jgi:hypothetical protein
MEAVTKKQVIYDYVANCLSENDKADFEAEMRMNQVLEQEVARLILKRMQAEQKVREHIEKVETERIGIQETEFKKKNNVSIKDTIKQKWGKLLENLSSN